MRLPRSASASFAMTGVAMSFLLSPAWRIRRWKESLGGCIIARDRFDGNTHEVGGGLWWVVFRGGARGLKFEKFAGVHSDFAGEHVEDPSGGLVEVGEDDGAQSRDTL